MSCVAFVLYRQKTAYEMRIGDWSSDVCSSDLQARHVVHALVLQSLEVLRPLLFGDVHDGSHPARLAAVAVEQRRFADQYRQARAVAPKVHRFVREIGSAQSRESVRQDV